MAYYRSSGALIGTLLGAGLLAVALTRARADFLYADEFYTGKIVRINTDDGSATTFASGLNYPEGMAIDHSGNLFVAEMTSGVIRKISPAGVVTPFVSNLGNYYLSGLAFDAAGDLYVGANQYAGTYVSAVMKYGPSGNLLSTWSWSYADPNAPLQMTGFVFDRAGNLIVADYSGNKLWSISPSGVPSLITPMYVNPMGLALDAGGHVFVSNHASGTIAEQTAGGFVTFASGLNSPAGLAFDAGNLYVADSGNGGELTRITPDGTASVFATGLDGPLFVVAVPEPEMLGMFSLAVAFWGYRRCRGVLRVEC